MRLLLDECAETLETLRLYPTDLYGEVFRKREKGINSSEEFVANNHALLRDFNLSRNKSLRTLETTASSIGDAEGTASDFFVTVLSSVTSLVPVDVVIIYRDIHFEIPFADYSSYQRRLEVSHKIHSTRGFRLVLCADVCDRVVERAIQGLEDFVKAGRMKGGLSRFPYKPLIISERRLLRTREYDCPAGASRSWRGIPASAL